MLHSFPILEKKSTSYKKKVHIHFDDKDEFPTQDGDQLSVTDAVMKRQNKLL